MRREKEGENTLRKFGEKIRRPSTLCSALQKMRKYYTGTEMSSSGKHK